MPRRQSKTVDLAQAIDNATRTWNSITWRSKGARHHPLSCPACFTATFPSAGHQTTARRAGIDLLGLTALHASSKLTELVSDGARGLYEMSWKWRSKKLAELMALRRR